MGQRAAIYARVSTADQCCERQVGELTAFAERGGFEGSACSWKSSGEFLGQLVDGKYILRRNTMIPPVPKVPKVPPVPPVPPIRPINLTGRIPKVGWTDALEGSWE